MKRFVVDRIESGILVLQDEDGADHEVPAKRLPSGCRSEGAVLSVPDGPDGKPDWSKAERDHAEEKRLLAEAEARLARLRRRDPGGDVKL